jgi:hypothetical protein
VVFRFALRAGYTVIEYPCEEVFRWALFVLFGDWGDLGDPFVTHSRKACSMTWNMRMSWVAYLQSGVKEIPLSDQVG